jgi:hypothetical protein
MHDFSIPFSSVVLVALHNIIITNLQTFRCFASLILTREGYNLGLMRTPVVGASYEKP